MKELVLGFYGFGKSAQRYHLPYIRIREGIRVKTIVLPSISKRAEEIKAYPDVIFTEDEIVMLEDPEIDMIVVATPSDTHFCMATRALHSGKHVLVDKPFCSSFEEAWTLLELAKEKGLIAMPYQNRRFDSDILTARSIIESGRLGDIVEIESHFDYYRPYEEHRPGSWYIDGALFGLGIHTVDQMTMLFGIPDSVVYERRSLREERNPEDSFEITLYYGKTKAVVKTSHLVGIPYPRLIIHGTKGSFVKQEIDRQEAFLKEYIMPGTEGFGLDSLEDFGILRTFAGDKSSDERFPTVAGDYGRVYDHMRETILHGEKPYLTGQEILTDILILEKAFSEESPFVIRDFRKLPEMEAILQHIVI